MIPELPDDIPKIIRVPDFWDRLRVSKNKFLALDYDGTLAPFKTSRMEAKALEGIPELLADINARQDTELAVISGRPIEELVDLLGEMPIRMVGSHGFEHRGPEGNIEYRRLAVEQEEGLVRGETMGIDLGYKEYLESKTASIALHTRGLPSDMASTMQNRIYRSWGRLESTHHLELRYFNGGVELRAKGWNKGDALKRLILGLEKQTWCVYIGDDETDEDAFEQIRPYGIGIKVGGLLQATKAQGFLKDIYAVRKFLQFWRDLSPYNDQEVL